MYPRHTAPNNIWLGSSCHIGLRGSVVITSNSSASYRFPVHSTLKRRLKYAPTALERYNDVTGLLGCTLQHRLTSSSGGGRVGYSTEPLTTNAERWPFTSPPVAVAAGAGRISAEGHRDVTRALYSSTIDTLSSCNCSTRTLNILFYKYTLL